LKYFIEGLSFSDRNLKVHSGSADSVSASQDPYSFDNDCDTYSQQSRDFALSTNDGRFKVALGNGLDKEQFLGAAWTPNFLG
jgi:hypothetical protein